MENSRHERSKHKRPKAKPSTCRNCIAAVGVLCVFFIVYTVFSMISHEHDFQPIEPRTTYLDTLRQLNRTLTSILQELRQREIEHNQYQPPVSIPIHATLQSTDVAPNTIAPNTIAPDTIAPNTIAPAIDTHQTLSTLAMSTKQEVYRIKKKAVIYTMDSISAYEKDSLKGGAAGELIIRRSLEVVFHELGVEVTVLRSDDELRRCQFAEYQIIVLDPWTWAGKGWVLKPFLRGHEAKIFILDFFGSPNVRNEGITGLQSQHILTAFGSPWDNAFLGYFMDAAVHAKTAEDAHKKLRQGVVWGKDRKHFEAKRHMLEAIVADDALHASLVSTARNSGLRAPVQTLGHQSAEGWSRLLAQSKFLLGMGHPILGPSAIDAVAMGCMFINPMYEHKGQKKCFHAKNGNCYASQHPYAAEKIGAPYVCSYRESSLDELKICVAQALNSTLEPHIPKDFQKTEYVRRVKKIFSLE